MRAAERRGEGRGWDPRSHPHPFPSPMRRRGAPPAGPLELLFVIPQEERRGLQGMWPGWSSATIFVPSPCVLQVGSRVVIVAAGCVLLLMGIFGKIGAAFATIPTPVIGGMFLVMFGVITAVGISNLQVRQSTLGKAAALHLLRGAHGDGDEWNSPGTREEKGILQFKCTGPKWREEVTRNIQTSEKQNWIRLDRIIQTTQLSGSRGSWDLTGSLCPLNPTSPSSLQ